MSTIKMDFIEYFKKKEQAKFVIILGSGFHQQALPENEKNSLSSWTFLLSKLNNNIEPSFSYTLDFELMISKKSNEQNVKKAYEIEKELLIKICDEIKQTQEDVIKSNHLVYPVDIFQPNFVSDVISLNFDLLPEYMLNHEKPKIEVIEEKKTIKEKYSKRLESTRHSNINGINFWHPHGEISEPNSILLGIRKYGSRINEVEYLRNRFKRNERKASTNYEPSWFDKIMSQPVIVLGASLSHMEWDIWYALVNRMRNFSKKESMQYEFPIFMMKSEAEQKKKCSYFLNITSDSVSFDKQWQIIEETFKTL